MGALGTPNTRMGWHLARRAPPWQHACPFSSFRRLGRPKALVHGIWLPQVPCATTLCVVALGAGEARVEALASEFVQLRAVPAAAAAGSDGAGGEAGMADLFLFDDDDTYQVPRGCVPWRVTRCAVNQGDVVWRACTCRLLRTHDTHQSLRGSVCVLEL